MRLFYVCYQRREVKQSTCHLEQKNSYKINENVCRYKSFLQTIEYFITLIGKKFSLVTRERNINSNKLSCLLIFL